MHSFNTGATTVIMRRFIADEATRLIERHAVTLLWAAPAMLRMMLAEQGTTRQSRPRPRGDHRPDGLHAHHLRPAGIRLPFHPQRRRAPQRGPFQMGDGGAGHRRDGDERAGPPRARHGRADPERLPGPRPSAHVLRLQRRVRGARRGGPAGAPASGGRTAGFRPAGTLRPGPPAVPAGRSCPNAPTPQRPAAPGRRGALSCDQAAAVSTPLGQYWRTSSSAVFSAIRGGPPAPRTSALESRPAMTSISASAMSSASAAPARAPRSQSQSRSFRRCRSDSLRPGCAGSRNSEEVL
ncbi:hypothetical protein [Streptomyces sp. NPDC046805]|uniref:hypothetical protein n=1 Tax=Streptomyces sp. NPDC046805 TaxID=3155134 RepID=UPI0033D94DF2